MRRRGFALSEAMVAVLLIATALFVLLGAFPLASKSARWATDNVAAGHLLQTEMERMRALGYATMASQTKTYTMALANNGVKQSVIYTSTVTVTESPANRKQVRVVITWTTDHAGSVEGDTYIANI